MANRKTRIERRAFNDEYRQQILELRTRQARQPLALVFNHDLYHRFRYLHHSSYLALTRCVVTRRARVSRVAPRTARSGAALRYIVRAALYSCP